MTAYIWGGFVSQQINGQLERPIRDSLSKYNGEKNSETEAVDSMQTLVSVFSTLIIDFFFFLILLSFSIVSFVVVCILSLTWFHFLFSLQFCLQKTTIKIKMKFIGSRCTLQLHDLHAPLLLLLCLSNVTVGN